MITNYYKAHRFDEENRQIHQTTHTFDDADAADTERAYRAALDSAVTLGADHVSVWRRPASVGPWSTDARVQLVGGGVGGAGLMLVS